MSAVTTPAAGRRTASTVVASLLRRSDISVVLATLALFAIFSAGSSSFLTEYNLFNMGRTAALHVFVAIGQAIVVVIGGMNLSLGAIGGLSVVMAGMAMQDFHLAPPVAFLIALLVGALAGLFNGVIVTRLHLNSFVATLATSFIFAGLVNGLSRGNPYTNILVFRRFRIVGEVTGLNDAPRTYEDVSAEIGRYLT